MEGRDKKMKLILSMSIVRYKLKILILKSVADAVLNQELSISILLILHVIFLPLTTRVRRARFFARRS